MVAVKGQRKMFSFSQVAVILVDTQGTFDRHTEEKENTAIVAISTIFSSMQIFNYKEQLTSQDLTNAQVKIYNEKKKSKNN
jgi:atlastin